MKQFMHILNFEFSGYLKNKVFIGITLVMVLVVTVCSFSAHFHPLEQRGTDSRAAVTG